MVGAPPCVIGELPAEEGCLLDRLQLLNPVTTGGGHRVHVPWYNISDQKKRFGLLGCMFHSARIRWDLRGCHYLMYYTVHKTLYIIAIVSLFHYGE
jgi:hypothetical protein